MKRLIMIGVITCIIIALGVGAWLGSDPTEPSAYELERTAMSLEISRTDTHPPFKLHDHIFRKLFLRNRFLLEHHPLSLPDNIHRYQHVIVGIGIKRDAGKKFLADSIKAAKSGNSAVQAALHALLPGFE